MAKYAIEDTTLTGIADAIREKAETTEEIPVTEMRPKILGITSGGMYASIFITGLSETDTVTATLGDKTKTAVWNSTKSRHEITGIGDKGMWTVAATDGTRTKTQDVLIDAPADFEIEMPFDANYLMLYDFGDECEDITGGWTSSGYSSGTSGYTISAGTKNSDNLFVKPGGEKKLSVFGTANNILFSDYVMFGAFMKIVGQGSFEVKADKKVYPNNVTNPPIAYIETTEGLTGWVYIESVSADSAYLLLKTQNNSSRNATLWAAFVLKADNWQTLCSKAGLSAPTDLATLIANTTSITAILANKSAVSYMTSKCTGDFMASFVASADCLSALDASPHKDAVLANKHWAKFLAMVGVTV